MEPVAQSHSLPSSPTQNRGFWERIDQSPVFFDIRGSPGAALFHARQASPSPSDESLSMSPESSQSSGKKKKKFRYGARDSIASRLRHGRPGSKRYQRFDNDCYLVKLLSDSESDVGDDEINFDESFEPVPGHFAFAHDPWNKRILEPFLDITEELQDAMMESSDEETFTMEIEFETIQDINPEESFRSLKIRSQRVLKKHRHSDHLHRIDDLLSKFSKNELYDDDKSLCEECIFDLEEPFARLILHAVAEYYDLVSYSQNHEGSAKRTKVVRRERRRLAHPMVTLREYLGSLDIMSDDDDY